MSISYVNKFGVTQFPVTTPTNRKKTSNRCQTWESVRLVSYKITSDWLLKIQHLCSN